MKLKRSGQLPLNPPTSKTCCAGDTQAWGKLKKPTPVYPRLHQRFSTSLQNFVTMDEGRSAIATRFAHLLQPIKDLTKNWDIDVASQLEEYLSEV